MKTTWVHDGLLSSISKIINESHADHTGKITGDASVNWAVGCHSSKCKDLRKQRRMQNDMVVVLHADQFFDKVNPIERVHPDDTTNHIRNRFDDAKSHFKSGQYMDLPEIAFNHTNAEYPVTVEDGRHRIAASYAMGRKTFPAIVTKDDFDKLSKVMTVHPYIESDAGSPIPTADISHHRYKTKIFTESELHKWLDPKNYGDYRSDFTIRDSLKHRVSDMEDEHADLSHEHIGNLSNDEYQAVHDYIVGGLHGSIDGKVGESGSQVINQHLIKSFYSKKTPKTKFEIKDDDDELVGHLDLNHLDSAIRANTHEKKFVTYSGIGFNPKYLMGDGDTIHLPAYTSSSSNKGIAIPYAKADEEGDFHILEIHHPVGSHGLYIGDNDPSPFGHKEHLMPRGETIKVSKKPNSYMDNNGQILHVWKAVRQIKKDETK